MIIKVESCWGGNNHYTFRLTTPDGSREYVRGDEWSRKLASEALDIFEKVYGLSRRKIRFDVR